MDIQRAPRPTRNRYIAVGLGLAAVLIVGLGLSRIKPASPSVQRAAIWTDTVAQGLMVIQARGNGTLVPEQIRWISAETQGRVERKLVQPGTEVSANTILVELSNPDTQLELLEAERQLSTAEQQLVTLRRNLETEHLNQEALIAQVRSQYLEAQRTADALEELARREEGFISDAELKTAVEKADEMKTRFDIERRRLEVLVEAQEPQLRVQQEQIARLTRIVEFQRRRIESMQVRAGIDGVLQEMDLEEGEWVMSGRTLARVVVPGRLMAELRIPQLQARDVALGQRVLVDMRTDSVWGQVVRMDPAALEGAVKVDVALQGESPRSARPGLAVEGIIEIERLDNVKYVARPVIGQSFATVGLFKLMDDGRHAERVTVRLGRVSVSTIEIVDGLQVGDVVILSDMSRWDAHDRVRVKG